LEEDAVNAIRVAATAVTRKGENSLNRVKDGPRVPERALTYPSQTSLREAQKYRNTCK